MKKNIKSFPMVLIVLFILAVGIIFSGCTSESSSTKPSVTKQNSKTEKPVKKTLSLAEKYPTLETARIAFDGNHRIMEIKLKLDEALILYEGEFNEDLYSRASSVLVTFKNDSEIGVTEMEILDYMIASYVEGVNINFPEMAALSFVALESGDR